MEIKDDSLRADIYQMLSSYVTYGEWKTPNQFDHVFQRLMGLIPRPKYPLTLYRVLRLTETQRTEYEKGDLVLHNRQFSSWTIDLDAARKLAQTKGDNCIIISHQFPPSHIVIDVKEFYEDNDLDNYEFSEYHKYVVREHEVIVHDSGEMPIDGFNSYLFKNEFPNDPPMIGDRAFYHEDDENGFKISDVDAEQDFAQRGIYSVDDQWGTTYWVRSVGPSEWEVVEEVNEELDEEYLDAPITSSERDAAFAALADSQRGDPELAMLSVQTANVGGVLSYVVEHVGDLTHRMAQYPDHSSYSCGFELVEPKVRRCLAMLTSGYGFAREHEGNCEANAEYRKLSVEEFKARLKKALDAYAEEHSRLKVWNHAQWFAREAAVSLGNQQWDRAASCLQELADRLDSREEWAEFAGSFDPKFAATVNK